MSHIHHISCLEESGGRIVCNATGADLGPKGGHTQTTFSAMDSTIRAAEQARAAGRPLLVVVPRGAGAIMGLRRFTEKTFPARTDEEAARLATKFNRKGKSYATYFKKPVRWPHHTVSIAGLVGSRTGPGELQLARHGALILDEGSEWEPRKIGALASAIREDGHPVFLAMIRYRPTASEYKRGFQTDFCGADAFESSFSPIVLDR